jgi:two-component system OmpR family sensor kinase
MNRLFSRFLLLVLLSTAVATCLIYAVISWLFGDPLAANAARQAAPQIFLLEQYIDKAPNDEWLVRLNKVREVSQVKLELIPLGEALKQVSPQQGKALQRGTVVIDAANKAFFRRVDLTGDKYIGSEDDVIVARDLPIDMWQAVKMEALRFIIIVLALLIPIALWSRAHWQGLQKLAQTADQFGAGKLSARAEIAPSASIYPLAQQINHMAGRIEGLVAAQKSLLHSVSHELRTPIARLEFGLELLRDKAHKPALDIRIDALQADLAELNTLVNELLNMAKLDGQQGLQNTPFFINATVQDCVHGLAHELQAHELSIQLSEDDLQIDGEQRLLARAISNLLKNAAKYSEKKIAISISSAGASQLQIVVEDDGPGVPAAEREQIFEAFYRLDRSRDRATGGFGLGLAIVRQAVQRHGGTVSVETSALGGARFVIMLATTST